MRKYSLLLTLTFSLGLAAVLAVQAVPNGDQKKIAQLITQLGSSNFRERDHATKDLDAIGEVALDALRKASKNSDMEIADRATQLVARIEQRAANARLLAPTYVELSFKDTPVDEAVAELAKKSGYTIVIGGNRNQLVDRKVTFETGKVPFWKAFEMLCEKAELVESDPVETPVNGNNGQPVQQAVPLPPIQLKIIDKVQPKIEKPVEEKKAIDPKVKPLEKPKAPNGFSADAPAKDAKEEAPRQPQAKLPVVMPPVQLQQQLLQAQLQARAVRRPFVPPVNNTITSVDGKPKAVPTHVEGAIRVRAIDNPTLLGNFGSIPQGEFALLFEVKPEPKLQLQQIVGIKIDKAIDNYDQVLDQSLVAVNDSPNDNNAQQRLAQLQQARIQIGGPVMAQPFGGAVQNGHMFIAARLKKGEKETKSIKEIRGEVSLRIRTPVEALATIENILKAKGESKGKGDATLKILSVAKADNGDIKIQVEVQHSHEVQPRNGQNGAFGQMQINGNVIINGNVKIQINGPQGVVPPQGGTAPMNFLGLEMVDDKGGSVPLVQILDNSAHFQPAGRSYTATLLFRPKKDQEASKLAFMGTRLAVVDVPFVLKDVPVK